MKGAFVVRVSRPGKELELRSDYVLVQRQQPASGRFDRQKQLPVGHQRDRVGFSQGNLSNSHQQEVNKSLNNSVHQQASESCLYPRRLNVTSTSLVDKLATIYSESINPDEMSLFFRDKLAYIHLASLSTQTHLDVRTLVSSQALDQRTTLRCLRCLASQE